MARKLNSSYICRVLELRIVFPLLNGWEKNQEKNDILWHVKMIWNSNFSLLIKLYWNTATPIDLKLSMAVSCHSCREVAKSPNDALIALLCCSVRCKSAFVTRQHLGSCPYCCTRAFPFISCYQLFQRPQMTENKRVEVSDSEALGSNTVLLRMDLLTTVDQRIPQFTSVVFIFKPMLTPKRGGVHLRWGGIKPSNCTRLTQELLLTGRPQRHLGLRQRQWSRYWTRVRHIRFWFPSAYKCLRYTVVY